MKNYHVTYKDRSWHFKGENAERSIRYFETKEAAVDYAASYMHEHPGSLKIHKQDSTFEEERTYPRFRESSRNWTHREVGFLYHLNCRIEISFYQ